MEESRWACIQKEKDKEALEKMEDALSFLRYAKPNSDHVIHEIDRRYMVTITQLELATAYFKTHFSEE